MKKICPISKEELEKEYNEYGIKFLSQKYNVCTQIIRKWIDENNIFRYGRKYKREDLSNKRFGYLTAIRYCHWTEFNTPKNKTMWLCRCDCGKERLVDSADLRNLSITSCGCKNGDKVYKGYYDLSGTYYKSIINGAKIRNLDFDLSKEYLWELYIKQDKKCALTGLDIKLERRFGHGFTQTASLDRIDNSKGYIVGNVQWVHKSINFFKRGYSEDKLYKYCKLIYIKLKDKYENS